MIGKYKKIIALGVTIAFLTLLPIHSLPLPAEQAMSQDKEAMGSVEQAQNFIEKEQQTGYQVSQKNALPIILGIVALTAVIFVIVMLVTKIKYDVTGVWEFHNDFTTGGFADYDSIWTFTAYDDFDKTMGTFERNVNDKITKGRFSVINKKDVIFQDNGDTEQYIGTFDSKTTMSGSFGTTSGASGKWTAKKQ
jgi:hypothetical protein